ncbi:MAG: HEAT repeat domain-containing protein, partial [Gemmatimonadota bacterium]
SQVFEAAAAGAAAVVLVARAVGPEAVFTLADAAHGIGLEAFVEVRSEAELGWAIGAEADVICVGAYDLETLDADPVAALQLLARVPGGVPAVYGGAVEHRVDVERAAAGELGELFGQLRPTALRTVFAWLPKLGRPALRSQLETAAGQLASQNTNELVRLMGDRDRRVVVEAARRSGALRSAPAVAPLARLLGESDAEVRLVAVQALAEIASPGALQQLERMLEDPEREVRVATARAIAAKVYRPALARIEGVIRGKGLRDRDVSEKMAYYEAYGALAGDEGVALLDGILNSKGFLGRREDADRRACAAVALGVIGTPRALESLRKVAADAKDDVVVRTAVAKALRGGSP